MSDYISVIGLEIHAELLTKSKVFCTCGSEFGGDKNSRCCPVCAGMPGTLPIINRTAVEYTVRAGMVMGCDINRVTAFDRKNYFYPDLPKAYQISQLNLPVCVNGLVPIEFEDNGVKKTKKIRINRIHLEEDAGKLIHDDINGVSLADYNRCGIPLIEIVSEPDMSSAAEAKAFVEKTALLLKYAGVCDCKMEQGSIRADVNVSLMKRGDKEYGTRAEMKNLNSIKAIGRAIEFEIKRQSTLLDKGERVIQETRRFDDSCGETKSMRSKENAHDYRYFPEPDIMRIIFTDKELDAIKSTLPELPEARVECYTAKLGLSEADAKILVKTKELSDFFDLALNTYNNPRSVCNFIIGEMQRCLNLGIISLDKLTFTAEKLARLVEMVDTDRVTRNDAKDIFREMSEKGGEPEKIAELNGLLITNDNEMVKAVIDKVLAENIKAVEQLKGGENKVFGFIMGQCAKELKGVCTPKIIKEELEKRLGVN